MLVWQNVYLSKYIIADPAVQSIRKVVIQYIFYGIFFLEYDK